MNGVDLDQAARFAWAPGDVVVEPTTAERFLGDALDVLRREQERDDHGRFGSGSGDPKVTAALESVPRSVNGFTPQGSIAAWTEAHGAFAEQYKAAALLWTESEDTGVDIRAAMEGHPVDQGPDALDQHYADQIQSAADAFTTAFDSAPVIDGTIYRGVGMSKSDAASYKVGGTVELGPSSFSRDVEVSQKFTQGEPRAVIFQTRGARGLPIDVLSHSSAEHEVLSAGRFTIDKVVEGDRYKRVFMTQVT